MQLALDLNADGVEIDVYLTADKKVMALHDRTTSRTARGVNYEIKKTSSKVLEKIDVGAWKHSIFEGVTIPYLKDIFDMKPRGTQIVVEIKDQPDTVAPVKKLIEETGHPLNEFIIISFNMDTCIEARKQMPEIEVYYLESSPREGDKRLPFPMSVLDKAKEANLTGVDLDYRGVTEELVKKCHEMGMQFYVWTVDNEADVKRMARYGVDSITTNVPDRARRWVDEELGKK